MKVNSVCLYAKHNRKDISQRGKEVYDFLKGKVEIQVSKELGTALGIKENIVDVKNTASDLIVAIGGDGTLLSAARNTDGKKIPIVGVKCSGFGFLMEVEDDLKEKFERILKGDFFIQERSKLNIKINGKEAGNVLNDALLTSDVPGKIRHFNLDIGGNKLKTIKADALLFSTATGSTAHAFSAGGPVIDSRLDVYEIIPVCAFDLGTKSCVIQGDTLTKVTIGRDKGGTLVLEGRHPREVPPGATISVTTSKNKAYLVKFEEDFFSRVGEKL